MEKNIINQESQIIGADIGRGYTKGYTVYNGEAWETIFAFTVSIVAFWDSTCFFSSAIFSTNSLSNWVISLTLSILEKKSEKFEAPKNKFNITITIIVWLHSIHTFFNFVFFSCDTCF